MKNFYLSLKFLFKDKFIFIKNFLTYTWIFIIFVYVTYMIIKFPHKTLSLFSSINLNLLVYSLVLIVFGKILLIFLVFFFLKAHGQSRSLLFSWQAYSFADIAKYLPGGIWGIVGRISIYRGNKISLIKGTEILIFETVLLIFMFLITGFILILVVKENWYVVLIFLFIFLIILHLLLSVCLPKFNILERYMVCIIVFLACIFFGFSFAMLFNIANFNLIWSAGQFNISFAVGQIAIFAPSGIGIREMVIAFFPSENLNINKDKIIEIAIIHRLIWFVSDLIIFFPIILKKSYSLLCK
jgi:hypothetical protein